MSSTWTLILSMPDRRFISPPSRPWRRQLPQMPGQCLFCARTSSADTPIVSAQVRKAGNHEYTCTSSIKSEDVIHNGFKAEGVRESTDHLNWSGRRESNPHLKLGNITLYAGTAALSFNFEALNG